MRFAIQCFGEFRCCQEDRHLENFIAQFPEIFNENNEIDYFFLTTKKNISEPYIRSLLGEKLKRLDYVEDHAVIETEQNILNNWNSINTQVKLSLEELHEYREEVLRGIEIRTHKNLYVPSLYEELEKINNAIQGDLTIKLTKDGFVPLLYYRRMILNNIRKKYQTKEYDWVITCRLFDIDYRKTKVFDFLYDYPDKNTVYCSIDNITMTTPELTDIIYDKLGNYPVIGYEQWKNEEFKKEYNKVDIGIYYIRSGSTLCSENQMMWAVMTSCSRFINLRCGCRFDEELTDPSGFLIFCACDKRKYK